LRQGEDEKQIRQAGWEMSVYEHIISVSGGKDSDCLYLLALERGRPFRAVFADTGNEHDLTYDFVRALPAKTGGPAIEWVRADFSSDFERKRKFIQEKWPLHGVSAAKIERALELFHVTGNPFLDLCMLKGRFPSSKARFCTEELKVKPINEQLNMPILTAGRHVISWQGVRAEESLARSLLSKWQRLEQRHAGRLYAYRPLLDWKIDDVWALHDKHGLSPNPLYAQGMKRVGCMPCIMCRKEELREIASRFPEHIGRIAAWEALVSEISKRGCSTFFAACDDPIISEKGEISHQTHGIINHVEWSKTDRGGRQYNLITSVEFGTACNQWGACEAPV
jgi:3'-phosphoadenosine 5'-phosphosulfate sulfotransferase (PAPS reductase)/FAD synthetase